MSEDKAVRAIALAEAVKHSASINGGAAVVIGTAQLFLGFLNGDAAATAQEPKAATPKAETPKKPAGKTEAQRNAEAAARIAATEAAAAKDEDASPAPTKEAVGLVIEAMLKANKRKEAIALLKKYNAENVSASGVMEKGAEATAAFIDEANEILLAA